MQSSRLHSVFGRTSFRVSLFTFLVALLMGCSDSGTVDTPKPAATPSNTTTTPTSSQPPPAASTPTPVAGRSVVVLWNEVMLAAIRNSSPRPTVVSRAMFMVHSAMYDAWAVHDAVAVPTVLAQARVAATLRTQANKEAAVSQAAYHMLVNLFPAYETNTGAFAHLLANLGYAVVTRADTTPAGIGYAAAQAVLADRANDGANAANNFVDVTSATYPTLYAPVNAANPNAANTPGGATFNPNRWQPLRVPTGTLVDSSGFPIIDNNNPASFSDQVFLTPHWGAVKSFAITAMADIRPPPPPQAGSNTPYTDATGKITTNDAAYNEQVDEILNISATLTDEQKVIAEYWADGPRSETPPGHWNALAHGVSKRDQNTLDDDIKMYFALNAAIFDTSIAVWEAKRFYDYVRPVSAIRHKYAGRLVSAWGGPNRGTSIIDGRQWRPYQSLTFVTPAFAEFVSGHSGFSAAAAEVLTRFTGSNRFFDGQTQLDDDYNRDGIPDLLGQHIAPIGSLTFENGPARIVTLRWHTFQDAANEAGISRRYGGIHFQDGDLHGRTLGKTVAVSAWTRAEKFWNGTLN